MREWKLLYNSVLLEKTLSIVIDADMYDNSFAVKELIIIFKMKQIEGTANQLRIKFNDESVLGFLGLISSTSERTSKLKVQNLGNCIMQEWGYTGVNEFNATNGVSSYGNIKGVQISNGTINKIELLMNMNNSFFTEGSEILIYAR